MSKRLLAITLTLCILLTCVPAFAAEYDYYAPDFLPIDGAPISSSSTGADVDQMKIVLDSATQKAFNLDPKTVSAQHFAGAVLAGDFYYKTTTYVTFTDGTWAASYSKNDKVVDVFVAEQTEPIEGADILYDQPIPISGTYYDAEGKVLETCTIVKKQVAASSHPTSAAIIKTVPNQAKTAVCINIYKEDLANATNDGLPIGKQFGNGAWELQNVKLYPTKNTVDSGAFPEGTVFISSSALVNNPGGWSKDTTDGYNFYRKASSTSDGPFALFSPKATETYDVYCLMKEKNDTDGSRSIGLSIGNQGVYSFKKNNANSTHSWYWEKENKGKTLTLTKDEAVLIQAVASSFGGYGRYAGIALVPTSKNFNAFPDAASAHANIIELTGFEFLQKQTIDIQNVEKGPSVNVTVDNTNYSVNPGTASGAGISVPTFHKHGEFITNALVWDALAAAGITNISDKAIYVNGKVCYSPQYAYLKEGDVIVTTAPVDVTNFSRVKLTDIHETDGSATLGGIKMCLNYSKLGSVLGAWAQPSGALIGARFSGYFETLEAAVTGLGVTNAGEKIYFESVEAETEQKHTTSRVDLQLDNRINPNEAKNVVKTAADGETKIHSPYAFVNQKKNSWYSYDNIYMINSTAPVGVTPVKLADGKYALDTEGDKLITIIKITYADDGKTIIAKDIKDDYITFDHSSIVTIEDNQKVFVWGRRAYNAQPNKDGTTMVPLCAPITK